MYSGDALYRMTTAGSMFGRYELLGTLGRGGFATVYRARDTALGREVALKALSRDLSEDPETRQRFLAEAQAIAGLRHSHIVTIYDVGVGGGAGSASLPFIVMEHLIGGTVGDAIRLESVTAERALVWIRQAAAGLDYAHRHGVVHGDIKPANLLLDGEHAVHVSDFGLARILNDEDKSTLERFGTAAYLSPEQAAGAPPTQASDRYALGVVAFELLTGQRPFAAEPSAVVIRHHRESAIPAASGRNPELPRALDAVFVRALAKQADERWLSAMECATAIERQNERNAPFMAPEAGRTGSPTAPCRDAVSTTAPPSGIMCISRATVVCRPLPVRPLTWLTSCSGPICCT